MFPWFLTTPAEIVCVAPQLRPAAPTRAKVEGTTPYDSPRFAARISPIRRPTVAPMTWSQFQNSSRKEAPAVFFTSHDFCMVQLRVDSSKWWTESTLTLPHIYNRNEDDHVFAGTVMMPHTSKKIYFLSEGCDCTPVCAIHFRHAYFFVYVFLEVFFHCRVVRALSCDHGRDHWR